MPKRVNFVATNTLTINNIKGFIKRKVTEHGTGAKVTCPREHLGKTAYLIITDEEWADEE
jgi:putative transposon-encoded protein